MIAITFALPAESSAVSRQLHRELATGDVVLFHTGVGRQRCEASIAAFLDQHRPALLIGSGFAGALNDRFEAGDLVIVPNHSDLNLVSRAAEVLPGARTAKLFTSDRIAHTRAEREALAQSNGADIVDMETEVIAAAANARAIPMLSLRIVSDSARQPFPAPPDVLFDVQQQRTNPFRLARYFITHPQAVLPLVLFSRRVSRLRETLAGAISAVVHELS